MKEALYESELFKGIKPQRVDEILQKIHHQYKAYQKDEYLYYSGESCDVMNLLVEGSVRGEIVDFRGKVIKVEDIFTPDVFAPAFLFASENNLMVDIIANTKVRVLRIAKSELVELLKQDARIMENYLRIISDRFVIITQKMKFLSLKTIKGKIAHYLLMRKKRKQQNKKIRKHKTQEQLAEYFGITRPSLTRELKIMEKEGVISLESKEIKILDREKLVGMMGAGTH